MASKTPRFQTNRAQRLLLFGAAALWFIAIVLYHRRDYQDSWILEDIFWPYVGFVVVFLAVVARESDNRVVALLCASAVCVIGWVPACKYEEPYGATVDATAHYLMTENLVTEGRVISDHVYAATPGMHSWLAVLALTAGLSPSSALKFGLPLTAGIMPLLVYWLGRRIGMPQDLAKFTLCASCLAIYPHHLPTGTGFTLVPLIMVLGALALRSFYSSARHKVAWTVLASIGLLQVILWHSIVPLLLPVTLFFASFTTGAVRFTGLKVGRRCPDTGLLRFALTAAILFSAYHLIAQDRVLGLLVSSLQRWVENGATSAILPQRFFDVTLLDRLRIALVMHGRDIILFVLTILGLAVILHNRGRWRQLLPFYTFIFLICVALGLFLVAAYVGADYGRFVTLPVAFTPFFAGPSLWWIFRRSDLENRLGRWTAALVRPSSMLILIGGFTVQLFVCQPMVPKARVLGEQYKDEYLVWLHDVNSTYQKRMLTYAETHIDPRSRFAIDYRGMTLFTRYFGPSAAQRRGLSLPLHWRKPLEGTPADYLLLHLPGPAGGLIEQVENRSAVKILALRENPAWDLIYDNGPSFILRLR